MIQMSATFLTAEEAADWRQRQLVQYDPRGYGTSLDTLWSPAIGLWVVSGSRWSSCD